MLLMKSSWCAAAGALVLLLGLASARTLAAQETPRLMRPSDVDTIAVHTAGTKIAYGADSLQFGELRLPEGVGPFPVAIVLHGGCWYSPYASVRSAAPLAEAITRAGIATWNVEYRRYDNAGGGWPGTFADAAAATDIVRRLAREFPLDTTRVLTVGHSAGGQLALWLATRHRLDPSAVLYTPTPLALTAVVSLGGIVDMRAYQLRERATCGNPAVESVLGGLPDSVPARYREVSPRERLPMGVPHTHVAGALDAIAPRAELELFAAEARALGDSVTIVTVPALGHHDVMAPATAAGAAAVRAVVTLLRRPAPGRN